MQKVIEPLLAGLFIFGDLLSPIEQQNLFYESCWYATDNDQPLTLLRNNMEDQLDNHRKTPTSVHAANQNTTTSRGKQRYEAFDGSGKPSSYMEIRCVEQPSHAPQSRFFLSALFSTDYDDAFTLLYSYMAVEVRGRNLKEVRQAIQNGRCGYIQQFHESEYLKPLEDKPMIESIHFLTGEKLDDILSSYKGSE